MSTVSPYLAMLGVKKSFSVKPILRGIDLSIQAGERMALLGANGAGKTTLLRILAGLSQPGEGRITIDGLDLLRQTREIRRKVGFVAHQPYLYDDLTALENLLFFARMYAVEQSQARATNLLARVGLTRKARERASSLSRGQMQRLALARALLHSPQLLLLDEPDTGLDQEGGALLNELLEEHTEQGGTMLFTTHDLEVAMQRSDQIAILRDGRVAYQQATASLEEESIRQAYQEVVR
ncbi:MAG TPA: heme ABC exporter ATP-binding protein CcmA [Ktedonobacteraceae bacterium]